METRSQRPTLKTYTKRKRVSTSEEILKRRRIQSPVHEILGENDMQSSDGCHAYPQDNVSSDLPSSDSAVFSEEEALQITPPSSPPAMASATVYGNVSRDREAPHEASQMLHRALQHIAEASSRINHQAMEARSNRSKPLVQMRLSFGQTFQKRCKVCGMEYVPCNAEDAALHKRYHEQNTTGIAIGQDFARRLERKASWRGRSGDFIAMIERTSTSTKSLELKRAREVLDFVQQELGAVAIPDDVLWGLTKPRLSMLEDSDNCFHDRESPAVGRNRFKTYLYIRNARCIGMCLAEVIEEAYEVLDVRGLSVGIVNSNITSLLRDVDQNPSAPTFDLPIDIAASAKPAQMGVSRIWTSSNHRMSGIASALLDCAKATFGAHTLPKEMVAFSQPTTSGQRLARRWFGKESGWKVYID